MGSSLQSRRLLFCKTTLWACGIIFQLKFILSKKATKIDEIFTVDLTLTVKISSICVAFLENMNLIIEFTNFTLIFFSPGGRMWSTLFRSSLLRRNRAVPRQSPNGHEYLQQSTDQTCSSLLQKVQEPIPIQGKNQTKTCIYS